MTTSRDSLRPSVCSYFRKCSPATWAALRQRYSVGADPYDPRDNITAGTAYLRELHDRGIDNRRFVVLSGFRAPYYNDQRINEGAARASRHQFGDAADLIIDADGDGTMDDLNGDRRRDLRDLNVIGEAVAAVEKRFPELVGGLGTYAATGPRGPFAHIDVRVTSARWERARETRLDTALTRKR